MASKARDLSNFISTAAIDASEIGTGAITTDKIADTTITHAKLHTTMDLSGKTVTLPTINALDVTNNINVGGTVDGVDVAAAGALATNALPKAGGTMTGNLLVSGAKIGVGTTAPLGQLQVGGSTAVSADSKLVFGKSTAASQDYLPVIQHSSTGGVSNDLVIAATSGDGAIRMYTGASSGSGIFGTTNNDERMRIDSSGNVGIGTASPSSKLTSESAAATNIVAKSTNGNGGYMNFQGLASNGTQTFGVNHNGTIFTTSGLAVGGTGAANTLDDYEEGTWTPVVSTSGVAVSSVTFHTAPSGIYTKVGRQVTLTFYLHINVATGGTGNFQLTGVPFTALSTNGGFSGAISLYYADASLSDPVIKISSTFLSIIAASGNGGYFSDVTWVTAPIASVATGTAMAGTITYFV